MSNNPYRTLCADMLEAFDGLPCETNYRGQSRPIVCIDEEPFDRARALLAQPEPEGVSADEWDALVERAWDKYKTVGYQGELFMYDSDFGNALDFVRKELAPWGHPTPQPEGGDIHYAWELHDAEGDWQAGGSAITLESVRREGNHYLQTYSQDGPHTLIIQRVSTIKEVTNV
jgi:hypothetical protein